MYSINKHIFRHIRNYRSLLTWCWRLYNNLSFIINFCSSSSVVSQFFLLYFLLIEVHFILHFHCLLIITLYFTHVHVFTAIIIDDSFVTVHGAAEGEELVQLGDRRGRQWQGSRNIEIQCWGSCRQWELDWRWHLTRHRGRSSNFRVVIRRTLESVPFPLLTVLLLPLLSRRLVIIV